MMSLHDKRLHGKSVDRKRQRRTFMLQGAKKISLFQNLPKLQLGTVADDWIAVGDDLRTAMTQSAAACE